MNNGQMANPMWTYQYKHGDRPLDGYTIQSAAGRGGFGEVYYALSDAGREVALKVVTGYEQIEVRGISQCMNLKSPHLVSIFDVKYNSQGKPFVIMEYVSGPSLRQLLDENPSGLGEQKSAFFLREIAKGLSFLHDCGIVHRDLKPGNIFYENGYVKIGDYGLSKAIATSPHSGQTVTVGTVHYMAPEVGAGKYDRGIDIYALGAVLYEMLTGTPPFVGASPSEVLLKHLSAVPDCTHVSEPYATVIKRAMAKDPTQRYQSVQEMVEGVFGSQHVRVSMSVFSPQDLSMVAGRVAQQVALGGSSGPTPPQTIKPPPLPMNWNKRAMMDEVPRPPQPPMPNPSRDFTVPLADPMPLGARLMLAIVTTFAISIAASILAPSSVGNPAMIGLTVASAIMGGAFVMAFFMPPVLKGLENESKNMRRLVSAAMGAGGMLVCLPFLSQLHEKDAQGTALAVLISLLLCGLDKSLRADGRRERINFGGAIGAGVIAFVVCMWFNAIPHVAIAISSGTILAAQALAPWKNASNIRPASIMQPKVVMRYWTKKVPFAIRMIWMGLFALALSLTIAMAVGAANTNDNNDRTPMMIVATIAGVCAILFAIRMMSRVYYGIWNYLLRPLLMTACVVTVIGCAIAVNQPQMQDAQFMAMATFWIMFPSIVLIGCLFIPGKHLIASAQTKEGAV